MAPRTPTAVANSVWNLSILLQSLSSSTSTSIAFTKCSACLFSSSAHLKAIKEKRHQRKSQDPYREAQARQRKNANLARQKVLRAERQATLGDPVRSAQTPFIRSLKNPQTYTQSSSSTPAPTANQEYVNFYLNPKSMATQLSHSKWLTEPIPQSEISGISTAESAEVDKQRGQMHETQHVNAERALQSITSLRTGSSKDLTRVNVQRCITEFGRHNTDTFISAKPAALPLTNAGSPPTLSESEAAAAAELETIPKRVGHDTGSSEVQIAILTTKINVLAENLKSKDKNNKRNLRLLVHRRQKLLSYLRRKERGGPRWTHLIEKLGINDAMWKGEISLS